MTELEAKLAMLKFMEDANSPESQARMFECAREAGRKWAEELEKKFLQALEKEFVK